MVAAAVIGAGIGGALISSSASKSAVNSQADSANQSANLSYQEYLQTRADQAPWRDAGTTALSSLTSGLQPGGQFTKTFGMSNFTADPGYQFRVDEGNKSITNAAAARGASYSGATLKALQRFAQNTASDEYGAAYNRFNNDQTTQYNRLASVAGVGQTATNTTDAAAQTYANTAGQAIQNAGTARASGYVGTANAINGAVGQASNYYALQSLLPSNSSSYTSDAYSTPAGAVSNVLY